MWHRIEVARRDNDAGVRCRSLFHCCPQDLESARGLHGLPARSLQVRFHVPLEQRRRP